MFALYFPYGRVKLTYKAKIRRFCNLISRYWPYVLRQHLIVSFELKHVNYIIILFHLWNHMHFSQQIFYYCNSCIVLLQIFFLVSIIMLTLCNQSLLSRHMLNHFILCNIEGCNIYNVNKCANRRLKDHVHQIHVK